MCETSSCLDKGGQTAPDPTMPTRSGGGPNGMSTDIDKSATEAGERQDWSDCSPTLFLAASAASCSKAKWCETWGCRLARKQQHPGRALAQL